jgi:hypothetical protein
VREQSWVSLVWFYHLVLNTVEFSFTITFRFLLYEDCRCTDLDALLFIPAGLRHMAQYGWHQHDAMLKCNTIFFVLSGCTIWRNPFSCILSLPIHSFTHFLSHVNSRNSFALSLYISLRTIAGNYVRLFYRYIEK